jgi:hypothetical protein
MIVLFALVSSGCSTLKTFFGQGPESAHKPPPIAPQPQPLISNSNMETLLRQARDLIRTGKDEAARNLLVKITAQKSLPGVTDEALFHQGILSLKFEIETSGYPLSRQILERLIHDYPGSVWSVQATPLHDLLVGHWQSELSLGKARRQIKTLKESNLSLTRENKEMHLNIEKLKTLEQELELKSRR